VVPKPQKQPEAPPPKEKFSVAQLFEQMKSMSSQKLVDVIKETQTRIARISAMEQDILAELKKNRQEIEDSLKHF